MRPSICAIALAAASLTASGQSAVMPKAPVVDTAVRMGPRLDGPRHDSTELALIAQLKALYSDSATRAMFDKSLSNPSIVGMQTPNPEAQAIVDRIFAHRRAYRDSVVATWPKQTEPPLLLHATVVLVDSLSDSLAIAEVRRRADIEPHEVILLPAGHATLGAIEAGIQSLSDLWVGDGLAPVPSSDASFMVRGEKLMKSWSRFQQDMMMSQLTTAQQAAKTPIAGIGDVRWFTIIVAHRRPAPAKP